MFEKVEVVGLVEYFSFIFFVDDICFVWSVVDIVVVLLIELELFGMVVIEVMVVVLLVIVVEYGGLFDIVEYECMGLFFRFCDIEVLVEVFYWFVCDFELCICLGVVGWLC